MKTRFSAMRLMRAAPGGRKGLWREDGQSLVEFAITSSILMAFIFFLIEVMLIFYSFNMISECAREGARYAMVRGSSCTTSSNASCTVTASQVNTYVQGLGWPNLGGGTMTVSTTYSPVPPASSCSGPTPQTCMVDVTVNYTFPVRIPYVPNRTVSMRSTSEMAILQ